MFPAEITFPVIYAIMTIIFIIVSVAVWRS